MRSRAKRPAFAEERVPCGAVSALSVTASNGSVSGACAPTGVRHANSRIYRGGRHVVNRAHRRTISALPKTCPSRGAIPTWDVVQGSLGGAMSYPSPTTHRFDVSNNRRVRLRIGAAAMGAGIVVFAYVVLYSNAIAAPTEYAVDGLAVGTQLNFGSASYREYKCSPSDQFNGLTWCQKTRSDKERRRSYIAAYSLLHSRDGNIL